MNKWKKTLQSEKYPIIVYLHGNSFDRTGDHRCRLYNVLSALDFHIITMDYRGYGDSTGSPSESGIVSDGIAVYKYAKKMAGNNDVFIWGHSMGTGVATKVVHDLALENQSPVGLILESPFNNLTDVVLNHPLSIPFRWLPFSFAERLLVHPLQRSGIDMRTDERILNVQCPILIMHAQDDHIIPYELAERLRRSAEKAKKDVTFIEFGSERGFGHKYIFRAHELPTILLNFLEKCVHQ